MDNKFISILDNNKIEFLLEKILVYFCIFRSVVVSGIFANVFASKETEDSSFMLAMPFQLYTVVSFLGSIKALEGLFYVRALKNFSSNAYKNKFTA